ncbi:cytosolic factor, phosphatidylinositol/phosphatidylcholine transfer protein [Polyrhizophydium stewartii]|uniref:Cytosolic factor, phosphatidylinositol/phosphatidylcholine transfer protein n=1 Tax=Polyrhizophydium stewartii TaxID=2732419 RepID=A0ABR4N3S2_9FUNG|nr:cytosolic factor, phosphatidylinositol/phosphatidylcholine transfer protein [Polyrhizophydium stewartii]
MAQVAPIADRRADIDRLRDAVKAAGCFDPERHDDHALLRFLRARRFDGPKAERMLLDCEAWRKEFGVEDVVQNFAFPEAAQVARVYPRFYHKTDRAGRPIYIERLSDFDVKRLFELTDQDRVVRRHVREYEKFLRYRLPACSARAGTHIEQGCTIIDLKGVPLAAFNQVRKVLQTLSAIAQNYYPETMGRMFIVNAPTLFTAVWAVIKGMLDENTVAKISVLGSAYQKQLLEAIDPSCLPASLGGACACPGGCECADIGPWNDGSVKGYPIAFWEEFSKRDGLAPAAPAPASAP